MHPVNEVEKEVPERKSRQQLDTEFKQLKKNQQRIIDKLFMIEERLLSTDCTTAVLESEYKEADKLSKVLQYLHNIEYNRYVLPLEQAKQQAQQGQQAPKSKIIAEA